MLSPVQFTWGSSTVTLQRSTHEQVLNIPRIMARISCKPMCLYIKILEKEQSFPGLKKKHNLGSGCKYSISPDCCICQISSTLLAPKLACLVCVAIPYIHFGNFSETHTQHHFKIFIQKIVMMSQGLRKSLKSQTGCSWELMGGPFSCLQTMILSRYLTARSEKLDLKWT